MRPSVRVGVVVPAAGSGQRMGGVPKAFLPVDGEPMLAHTLRAFLEEPRVSCIVVALSPRDAASPPDWLVAHAPRVRVVAGGETRTASVRNALDALPADVDIVAVHDAARPLVTSELLSRCIEIASRGEGAVAGAPAVDTIKDVDPELRILGTPDRSRLWHAQTPQVFPIGMIRAAYARIMQGEATDDAGLVERTGHVVRMVESRAPNLKITRPEDVLTAESLLRARRSGGAS